MLIYLLVAFECFCRRRCLMLTYATCHYIYRACCRRFGENIWWTALIALLHKRFRDASIGQQDAKSSEAASFQKVLVDIISSYLYYLLRDHPPFDPVQIHYTKDSPSHKFF
jgi:hypothetical protein